MAKNHVIIEVGKRFPGDLHISDGAEGCKLNITADPPIEIIAIFPRPTAKEVYNAQSGTLRVGLLDAGDHTFFWLLNMRHHPEAWADMPYAVGLLPLDQRPKLQATPDRGYAISFALVDERKIVRSLRLFTVTPRFSQEVDRLLTKQIANIDSFTPQRHAAEIAAAYAKYPLADKMAEDAIVIETAGKKFPQ